MDNFRQPYPLGTKLPEASAKNFIGQAYIAPITVNRELNVPMSNVTFEPRCRNNWHYHKGGQILVASAGIGYYQEKGKPARRLYPGDIVEIAPDVIHWHGAAPDSWFAHVAVSCNPQTLIRDIEYLKTKGAKVDFIQPFDMFCHTYHTECVTIIDVE